MKWDYRSLSSRAGWQLPDRVIDSLEIQPGDRVADVGAGDGYFTFRLSPLVPRGRVLAVDIQQEMLDVATAAAGPQESAPEAQAGEPVVFDDQAHCRALRFQFSGSQAGSYVLHVEIR